MIRILSVFLLLGCTEPEAGPTTYHPASDGAVSDAERPDERIFEADPPDGPFREPIDAHPPDAAPADAVPRDGPPPAPDAAVPTDPPPPPPRRQAFFNHPPADGSPDTTLEDVLLSLLAKAEPGSEVRAAYYTFSRTRMAAALVAAAERGVDVRVVLGNTNVQDGCVDWQAVADLKAGLGRNVVICRPCENGGGCIGTGINHNKFMTFSALSDGSRNVVVQSSANLTNPQLHEHNNLVVLRDDPGLHTAYRGYWDDLAAQVRNLNYYHTEDGDHTRVYFYPRSEGDTVVGIIGNANCSAGTRIRVVMAFFTDARLEVAQALANARRAGCRVSALLRSEPAENLPGDDVLSTLRAGGVELHLFPLQGERTIHSKYLLIDGRYADQDRQLVWTGSHNYTGPALDANDETLLRIDDPTVFANYDADYRAIQAAIEAF